LADGLQRMAERGGKRYEVMLRHGTLQLGVYAPRGTDPQQPHEQDEAYIVMAGTGAFVRGGERIDFAPGDALFVPAGVTHRFEDFSDDFAVWVVFYGPNGGEPA
jgi:mannose-6-phosphate isomerase-like protein (cupin superfamily)